MIIFDFDGVLVESVNVKTQAFAKLFEPEGPAVVKQVVHYHLMNGGVSRYEKIKHAYQMFLKRSLPEDELANLGRQFSDLVVAEVVRAPWVKGAREFVSRFHNTLNFSIVSGTPHEELVGIVRLRKMDKYFRNVLGTPPKKEDIVFDLVQNQPYGKEEIVLIGDSLQDLESARKANVQFIARIESPSSPLNQEKGLLKIPDLQNLETVIGLR
jgi:phosphoglycolate phosphatase-like HAD superfamily hydrolase